MKETDSKTRVAFVAKVEEVVRRHLPEQRKNDDILLAPEVSRLAVEMFAHPVRFLDRDKDTIRQALLNLEKKGHF